MSFINWCVMVIPVIGILGLAVYSRKYVRGVADYLAAGRVEGNIFLMDRQKIEEIKEKSGH